MCMRKEKNLWKRLKRPYHVGQLFPMKNCALIDGPSWKPITVFLEGFPGCSQGPFLIFSVSYGHLASQWGSGRGERKHVATSSSIEIPQIFCLGSAFGHCVSRYVNHSSTCPRLWGKKRESRWPSIHPVMIVKKRECSTQNRVSCGFTDGFNYTAALLLRRWAAINMLFSRGRGSLSTPLYPPLRGDYTRSHIVGITYCAYYRCNIMAPSSIWSNDYHQHVWFPSGKALPGCLQREKAVKTHKCNLQSTIYNSLCLTMYSVYVDSFLRVDAKIFGGEDGVMNGRDLYIFFVTFNFIIKQ